jgi:flagellar motor switch protein FliN/FliY
MADTTAAFQGWLAEEWARQLTHVMESMTGEAPYVNFAPHELSEAEIDAGTHEYLWWEQPYSTGPGAILFVGAAIKSWEEIGKRVLHAAGVEDGEPADIRSTYIEIIRQALGGVAATLTGRAHKEVTCVDGREAPPPSVKDVACHSFEVNIGDLAFPVITACSRQLAELSTAAETAPEETEQTKLPALPAAVVESQKQNPIDLLLDVELPVSVSFGRAQLPLKDVIKLTTGSIVELNRAVSEPVEVIVNNCVIARGEVVVVEGNFGVRIKQVMSRQERLRRLH